MKTYNPKKVTVALGNHIVTGYADDSFIGIQQSSDGITDKVGCDGEVVRAISPDESFNISITLLQYSPSHKFLTDKYYQDIAEGNGTFSVTIKDILGETEFSTDQAWATKLPEIGYGRESNNRSWTLRCGVGKLVQG